MHIYGNDTTFQTRLPRSGLLVRGGKVDQLLQLQGTEEEPHKTVRNTGIYKVQRVLIGWVFILPERNERFPETGMKVTS
jgi:hypothetical protein